jgi:hypothetical protein
MVGAQCCCWHGCHRVERNVKVVTQGCLAASVAAAHLQEGPQQDWGWKQHTSAGSSCCSRDSLEPSSSAGHSSACRGQCKRM